MDYKNSQDSDLLSLLQSGNQAAFKEIYVRYWKELFLHACRKVTDAETARELVQNLFLSLWEKHRSLEIGNLKNYLYGSLRYTIIGFYRTQVVHERFLARSIVETESTSPEQEFNTRELSKAIELGISMLPARTREVFKLSRVEHHSTREIAHLLHLSEKTVEYHITQSLKSLRIHLKEHLLSFLLLGFCMFAGFSV